MLTAAKIAADLEAIAPRVAGVAQDFKFNDSSDYGRRVADVERNSDGTWSVTFGTWDRDRTGSGAALPYLRVSHVQPTTNRFKTSKGAAKVVRSWLDRDNA